MAVLVFDSAPLSAFARARQLPMLDRLTENDERVTTSAVIEELRAGLRDHPELQDAIELSWVRVEPLDHLDELFLLGRYVQRLGSGAHDLGEATVLAYAEAHGAIAFTDDQAAIQVGRERSVKVVRTLALVARGVRNGVLTESGAGRLVDDLIRAGGRYPFQAGEFVSWARGEGLFERAVE
jgi:predicted nucleic acid-binding protein